LDISKGALHNYLHSVRRVPDEVVQKVPQYLDESEFREIVQGVDLLKATGIVKESGAIDYSVSPLSIFVNSFKRVCGAGPRRGITSFIHTPWTPVEPNAMGLPSESLCHRSADHPRSYKVERCLNITLY
jgi:hypothetical protein